MTTTSLGTTPGAPWTWDTATWPWNDTYASATWDTSYPADYVLSVGEFATTKGNYLQMDGSAYIEYPADFPAGTYTAMTFEGWFRSNPLQTGNPGLFGINSPGTFMQMTNDSNNRLRCTVNTIGTVSYNAITVGAWYHVAMVYDAAAADGLIFKVYLNGAYVSGSSTVISSITFGAGAKVMLGRGNPTLYTGAMCGLRIWNHARTLEQINYWRFRTVNSLDPRLLFHAPMSQDDHINEKKTGTTNLYEWTDTLASPWGLGRVTKTNNAATDPLGGNTAIRVTVDTTASSSHYFRNINTFADGLYTTQICVKMETLRYIYINYDNGLIGGSQFYLFFDLLNGVFTTTPVASRIPYYTATDVGNGWWLLTVTAYAAFPGNQYVLFGVSPNTSTHMPVADGAASLLVWGPQLEAGMPTAYAVNSTGTAGGTPRTADRPSLGTNTFGQDGPTSDAPYKILTKPVAETMALAEVSWNGPEIWSPETLGIAEAFSDLFNAILNIGESVNFAEVLAMDIGIRRTEVMAITEAVRKGPTKNSAETMAIAEVHSDVAGFRRDLAETLAIAEAVRKTIGKNNPELLSVIDYILRKGDGVLADASFENTFLTPEQFLARFADPVPPAYAPWRPFIPGDYEYRYALVETKMFRQHLTQDTKLTRSEIRADMPDVVESGEYTVTLTSGTETVALTKEFVEVTDVQITGISGAIATTPRVPSYTNTGFNIELRDSSNTRQTGVVRYTVRGY